MAIRETIRRSTCFRGAPYYPEKASVIAGCSTISMTGGQHEWERCEAFASPGMTFDYHYVSHGFILDSLVQNNYFRFMARPKEFDRDAALAGALQVFWAKGYEGASTGDLLKGMKIGRQSMYDTFGDKQALYLECLHCYHKLDNKNFFDHLSDNPSPLEVLHGFLAIFTRRSEAENAMGCMGINAITAYGQTKPEVKALALNTAARVEAMLARLIEAAQKTGELANSVDADVASSFVYAALQGLTVRAQAGASRGELADVADFTIKALKAMR